MIWSDGTNENGGRRLVGSRSRSGASMSIALLLLLVCALLTSAVLAAISVLNGRAMNQAEMDQNYYSATSAAKLLKQEIEATANQKVVIKSVKKQDSVTEVTYNADGSVTTGTETKKDPTYELILVKGDDDDENEIERDASHPNHDVSIKADDKLSGQNLTLTQLAAINFMARSKAATVDPYAVWSNFHPGDGPALPTTSTDYWKYKLTHTVNGSAGGVSASDLKSIVDVNVEEKVILEDADLDFRVKAGDKDATKYWLKMYCEADVNIEEDQYEQREDYNPVPANEKLTRDETITTTSKWIASFTWSTSDIERASDDFEAGA